jgi:hypothetical protein
MIRMVSPLRATIISLGQSGGRPWAKDDGCPGAYSVTVSAQSATSLTVQASGSYYRYLGDVGTAFHQPDPASPPGDIDALLNLWNDVATKISP